MEAAAQKLSLGEVDVDITYESKDELGVLAESFRKTCAFLKLVIQDANRLLSCMAEGDFNISTDCEDAYIGEFEKLKNSMRMLNRKLNEILANINEVSEQVAEGSEQMAVSAQEVAEGAAEQAGAIEELQATIASVVEGVHSSTEVAENANQKANVYAKEAEESKQQMQEMVSAMNEISELSVKIGNIIENIEDIASQTNLLSLNASIEAARAGEAGKGFAVVAQQIGKLAEDSAKSAMNTRELIESSIEKIDSGNQIADRTAKSLDKVVAGIAQLAEVSRLASESSAAQEKSMEQIEAGVNQISEVVRSNSASSEETSAASEELSAHAVTLKEMVEQFNLRAQ